MIPTQDTQGLRVLARSTWEGASREASAGRAGFPLGLRWQPGADLGELLTRCEVGDPCPCLLYTSDAADEQYIV